MTGNGHLKGKGLVELQPEVQQTRATLDLSIVVVSYNTAHLLEKCLASVYANADAGRSFEIIVIDNASVDDSCNVVLQKFPTVKLIANPTNAGFAAATNQGLKLARGEYLLLLNPDTEVMGDALWQLVNFLDNEPQAAVVGGALLYSDKTFQEGAFRFPGLGQIFFDFYPLNWRLTRSRLNGRYPRRLYEGRNAANAFEIDFPLGACLMVRRSVVERVGYLDEAFFMYMEEIDFCYRIKHTPIAAGYAPVSLRFRPGRRRAHNWKIYCLPSAQIIHHAGASTRQFREEMQVQLFKSRRLFYQKHYSRRFQVAAGLLTRLGMASKIAGTIVKRLRRRLTKEEAAVRLRTYARIWKLQ
jgi:N-acetylglucosaminyl-diphospho-decaprenol L-rhamnosyltransferase